jgi:hypothetical protein
MKPTALFNKIGNGMKQQAQLGQDGHGMNLHAGKRRSDHYKQEEKW